MKVVVVGQGYVGLPLAQAAVSVGHEVVGLDLNTHRVSLLNSGVSVVDDLTDSDIREMLDSGYRASDSLDEYADADVVVICVPTPLTHENEPDLTAVRMAVDGISRKVSSQTLIILESTTYPGTTATEVVPKFQKRGFQVGGDLFIAFSPERIDPGNETYGIKNTPKVVGADDPISLEKAKHFYETFIDSVVTVSGTAEAELTKLLENTYRHINIGLVNELAIVCHELGIDVWEVIRAASTKPFGFQAFYPGPGVGGHCIPIDPNYLNYRVQNALNRPFRFVELAQDINSSMPAYVVSRIQDLLNDRHQALNGSDVLLVGVTYKAGISDTRESPAADIGRILKEKGANVHFYDPFVDNWAFHEGQETLERVESLETAVQEHDITVVLQSVPDEDLSIITTAAKLVLDTRGIIQKDGIARL